MDGAANPHDILRVLGEKELANTSWTRSKRLPLASVKINDKHIEVIVRQMLRRVRVNTWRYDFPRRRTSREAYF